MEISWLNSLDPMIQNGTADPGPYLQALAHRTYETTARLLAQKQTAILQEELRGWADFDEISGWATLRCWYWSNNGCMKCRYQLCK